MGTREQRLAYQKEHRKKTNNFSTKKYEKTKSGFLVRCYRNMLSRVTGVTKNKNHLYLGKEILKKEIFYNWAIADQDFNELFNNWEKVEYERKSTPSIDRINSANGYTLDNIRWITFAENSRTFGGRKLTEKQVLEIRNKSKNSSQKELSKEYSVSISTISDIIRNKRWKNI